MRHLVWFSCGAPSAIVAKLVTMEHPDTVCVIYCDTGGEHPDNARFLQDVARWIQRDIVILRNTRYADHFDVVRQRRYINGPTGAKCTYELKRKLRERFQLPGDIHCFGFTAEEQDRAIAFEDRNAGIKCLWPLIDAFLTRQDCLALIQKAGITLPALYQMGYKNNNCIGCVKGGAGYWNRIRKDFPEHFQKMAELERSIGHTVLRINGRSVFLDELDPEYGRYELEPDISCGLICHLVDQQFKESS